MSHSVLYLSYDGLTDPLGQSQILPYLKGLATYGYKITIVSFEKPERYVRYREIIAADCAHADITWLPQKYHKRPPVLSTIWDLYVMWRVAASLSKHARFSIVHARSYPPALIALRLKRKYGAKFIFDMRGFWADERVEGNIWNLRNPLVGRVYSFFKVKEKEMIAAADHVVTLTKAATEVIAGWGCSPNGLTVIPTCTDLRLFNPEVISEDNKKKLRESLDLQAEDFVLLYAGSWGTWYMKREMLRFFDVLKSTKPQAKFLIVSPDKVDVTGYEWADDVRTKTASRSEMPVLIAIASMACYFIKPTFSKKGSSATKLGEFVAFNIPIVTNNGIGDVEEIMANYQKGIVVQEFADDEYRRAVKRLDHLITISEKNAALSRYFSLERGIELYAEVYKQSIAKG